MVYLNTECNLEFVTKHREASSPYQFVLAISVLQSRVQHSNALQGGVTCS